MEKPKIAGTQSIHLDLEPGKYAYCTCGLSATQPFCDGKHAGTDFRPHVFEIAEACHKALCACKKTGNEPFCDGTHRGLTIDN